MRLKNSLDHFFAFHNSQMTILKNVLQFNILMISILIHANFNYKSEKEKRNFNDRLTPVYVSYIKNVIFCQ